MKKNTKYQVEYVKSTHNSGFFSCCSMRLDDIITFFNKYKLLPIKVDSSNQFEWYKNDKNDNNDNNDKNDNNDNNDKNNNNDNNDKNDDITFEYFEYYRNVNIYPIYKNNINYFGATDQFTNYKDLDYVSICPFVEKYFTPSLIIKNTISNLEIKYKINDYTKICVLFYRGNDKVTETNLCSYDDIIQQATKIFNNNNNIKFLIQSDETEFINAVTDIFPQNSFYFKDEIRHMEKQNTTVDIKFKQTNHIFSKYYLAITIIMSKCNYIICGSGNCSIWIMLYRGNANNVYQFLNDKWV